jgi:hypothetical protein
VAWLWIGGLIVGIGALIAIWPHGRPAYLPELAEELGGTAPLADSLESAAAEAGRREEAVVVGGEEHGS